MILIVGMGRQQCPQGLAHLLLERRCYLKTSRTTSLFACTRLLRASAQEWREKEGVKPGSALDKQLESTLRVAESDNAVNRQDLLKVFAETKKKLDSFGREVAFLAVDVVGSA